MKPEQNFYLIIGGKNDLDIDNDSDNWKLAFGRGGGWQQATRHLRQPGTWESHLFLMISGLLVQLLAKERHLHNVYKPPLIYFVGEGGGVAERGQSTAKGAWCLERAQSMIWLYLLYVE